VDPGAPQWVCLNNVNRVPACCLGPVSLMESGEDVIGADDGFVGERRIDEMRCAYRAAVSERNAEGGLRYDEIGWEGGWSEVLGVKSCL